MITSEAFVRILGLIQRSDLGELTLFRPQLNSPFCLSYDYIVSQMNFRSFEEMPRQHPESKSPDIDHPPQKYSTSHNKNPYIGLTLMEYFKLNHSKQGLQEIDEESNSSISAGTPCFADFKDQLSIHPQSKRRRREKARTQIQQDLLPALKDQLAVPHSKISTINFEEAVVLDKTIVKLPSIHENRHVNNSRQGMIKEGKLTVPKKESIFKFKNEQNSSLVKHPQIGRIHQIQKNPMVKKSLRARVTSTSFYHHAGNRERQRERIKTQEEVPEKILEKSFIVTKYGASFATKRNKEQNSFQAVKKQQNTFKLIKNTNS